MKTLNRINELMREAHRFAGLSDGSPPIPPGAPPALSLRDRLAAIRAFEIDLLGRYEPAGSSAVYMNGKIAMLDQLIRMIDLGQL